MTRQTMVILYLLKALSGEMNKRCLKNPAECVNTSVHEWSENTIIEPIAEVINTSSGMNIHSLVSSNLDAMR